MPKSKKAINGSSTRTNKKELNQLTPEILEKQIYKALESSNNMSVLEKYAVFMGKAQLIELFLKSVLINTFDITEETLEKFTLGQTINELSRRNMRGDFIKLLRELKDLRNEMAHNFLSDFALIQNLTNFKFKRSHLRILDAALFKVEEVIQVHSYLSKKNYLIPSSTSITQKSSLPS